MSSRLEDLRQERLAQIIHETELEQEIEKEVETQIVEEITNVVDAEDTEDFLTTRQNRQNIKTTEHLAECYVTGENELEDIQEKLPSIFDIQIQSTFIMSLQAILNQLIRHLRSGIYKIQEFESLLQIMRANCEINRFKKDMTNLLSAFEDEMRKVRTRDLIESKLNSMERSLLLESLIKIKSRLNGSTYNNFGTAEGLMFEIMTQIEREQFAEKLQEWINGECLLNNDVLKGETQTLIDIIENRKTFYLERCAINFSMTGGVQTKCEQMMLEFSKVPKIESLVGLAAQYKCEIFELKNIQYLEISKENFIKTLVENLRHFAIAELHSLGESVKTPSEVRLIGQLTELEEIVTSIHKDSSIDQDQLKILKTIKSILETFSERVKFVKNSSIPKKSKNKAVHILEAVIIKLIKYTDINTEQDEPSNEIKRITSEYLEMYEAN